MGEDIEKLMENSKDISTSSYKNARKANSRWCTLYWEVNKWIYYFEINNLFSNTIYFIIKFNIAGSLLVK